MPFSRGHPSLYTDKLQRVMNAAARVVTDTRKYDRGLTNLLHDELHWLDVPERVQYKLCTCNGSSLSAAQGTTLHGRLLHPHYRYCPLSAPAVRRPPSPACTATPPFHIRYYSVVGPFLWPDRWSGTRYQTTFEIQLVLLTVLVAI